MKKTIFLLALCAFGTFCLPAQVVLRGKIANIAPNAIQVALVDYWAVDHWQQLAILQLQAGGVFSTSMATNK